MWKQKPLTGYGLKSFRFKCWKILDEAKDIKLNCANHSHNYYLELLSEAGIIGTLLIIIFFTMILKDSFFFLKKNYKINKSKIILISPILVTFILEIWPLKSTGSFFTTWNATFFWLIVALLFANLYTKKNLI